MTSNTYGERVVMGGKTEEGGDKEKWHSSEGGQGQGRGGGGGGGCYR